MLTINSLICLLIVLRVMFFQRGQATHRPLISVLAYLITVAAGSEVLMAVLGRGTVPSVGSITLNAVLCLALIAVGGNVADLFKGDSYCQLSQLLRWRPGSEHPASEHKVKQ